MVEVGDDASKDWPSDCEVHTPQSDHLNEWTRIYNASSRNMTMERKPSLDSLHQDESDNHDVVQDSSSEDDNRNQ